MVREKYNPMRTATMRLDYLNAGENRTLNKKILISRVEARQRPTSRRLSLGFITRTSVGLAFSSSVQKNLALVVT